MKTKLILITGIVLLLSCTSQKTVLNSYIGATKQQVIMGFGVPSQTSDDGNGGEVLIYYRTYVIPGNSGTYGVGANNQIYRTQGTPAQRVNRTTSIYLNKDGRVYYWRIN